MHVDVMTAAKVVYLLKMFYGAALRENMHHSGSTYKTLAYTHT